MGSAAPEAGVHDRRSAIQKVAAVSLDEIVAIAKRPTVDLVKMDIEGAELRCLESAGASFWELRPQIVLEPHQVNGNVNTEALLEIFEARKYATVEIGRAHV